jgi:Zn-dependent protease
LVHREELNSLAKEAKAFEAKGDFSHAREIWTRSLAMLPQDSKQAEWVRDHVDALQAAKPPEHDPEASSSPAWAKRLGPLAPIAVLLAKSKGLLLAIFKLKFLLSFFSFIAVYVAIFGWRFGVGFAVCILIHEMGHFIDIKRRGLPAEMPVFLPGLGAYVQWKRLGVTQRQIAQVSLAGPLAGWLAALGCLYLYAHTHDPLWVGLARTGLVLNILNLVPVWVLDGGQAMTALETVERLALLAATLALWIYTGESIFFIVTAGIVWRLYTKDKPARSDWSTWLYFAALLVGLGVTLKGLPVIVPPATH